MVFTNQCRWIIIKILMFILMSSRNFSHLNNFAESQSRSSIRLHKHEIRFFANIRCGNLLRRHRSLCISRYTRALVSCTAGFPFLGVLRPRWILIVRRSDIDDSIALYKERCRREERELQAVRFGRAGSVRECCAYGGFCSCKLYP